MPAGSYLFFGDASVTRDGPGEWAAICRIAADTASDQRSAIHPSGADVVSVHFAGTLAAGGTASLRCNDSLSQPAAWTQAHLTAVPVDAINAQ